MDTGHPDPLGHADDGVTPLDITTLTRDERSLLVYAETCLVDHGGLLTAERLNAADMAALAKFKEAGILDFGRIPAKLLGTLPAPGTSGRTLHLTHWVTFHEEAWQLAHALRRARAERGNSANRRQVDEALAERAEG